MKETLIGRFATFTLENIDGRALFVTDPHGQFEMLEDALEMLKFNEFPVDDEKPDKLFCLGDMVDKGRGSLDVLQSFRYSPHRRSISGNHERTAYLGTQVLPSVTNGIQKQGSDREHWIDSGGMWHKNHNFYVIKDAFEWASKLPYAAEIKIGNITIGITHAEVSSPNAIATSDLDWFEEDDFHWNDTKELAMPVDSKTSGAWNLKREYALTCYRSLAKKRREIHVKGVDAVLHGHNIYKGLPPVRGNQIYMDGGASLAGKFRDTDSNLNILEFQPSPTALLGLFKVHQFYYSNTGKLTIRS